MHQYHITRGPRGPWVAHLRKRSKGTVKPIIKNPRGIIWTTLVEDLLMMLYIKYENTVPWSFRQKGFWKFHFKTYLLTQWTTYTTNWNGLNNFDRGPPRDHSCEVWSNSYKRFKRRCTLKFSLYNSMLKLWPPGQDQFWPQGHNLNNVGRGPLAYF